MKNFKGNIALVGAGQMGGAMLKGWLEMGLNPKQVYIYDPKPPEAMASVLSKVNLNPHLHGAYDVLILAVKPQIAKVVMQEKAHLASENTLILSIMAGTTLNSMQNAFGEKAIIRTIPNTPSSVGRGMTACFANSQVNETQKTLAHQLLTAIGAVEWVESESLIDVATAVSGSGPAYVFLLAEFLAKAGEKQGLSPNLAMTLARKTVEGAGELLYRSDLTPETLRQNVTSPNGTTYAALQVLMAGETQEIFDKAINAATKRSKELSQ